MTRPETLLVALERAAASGEGVRFLVHGRERFVPYRDVLERSAAVAGGLAAHGVGAGDRVGVVLPTGPEFYDAFFGALAAGSVPVSLPPPPRFTSAADYRDSIAARVEAARIRVLLTTAAQRSRFRDLHSLALEELATFPPERVDVAEDDVALVQLSSGTTGTPKAIPLTHRQVLSNVGAILDAFFTAYPPENGYEHGGVSWLPLYHDMGLVGSVFTALVHPGPLTLMRPEEFVARPVRWLEAISRYRATISAAPNFAYELALERIRDEEMRDVDLSCWLLALDGAEPVSPSTLERFYERFRSHGLRREALTPVYGLAEASLAVTFSDPRSPFSWHRFDYEALAKSGRAVVAAKGPAMASCGRPLPGFEIRIAGDGGEVLTEARLGRVLVRGPSMTSEGVTENGFLDTGDRGFLLDGELYLWGRNKDVVVVRGRNHAPEAIERAVDGVAGVRSGGVAAVGVVGERGEELCLLVERRRRSAGPTEDVATVAEIRARLSERCGIVPDRIVLLEAGALPRTSSGKIRRSEAARRLASERAGAGPLSIRLAHALRRVDPGDAP